MVIMEFIEMSKKEILEEIKYLENEIKELEQRKKNYMGNSISEVEMRRSINEEIEEVQDEIWDLQEKV